MIVDAEHCHVVHGLSIASDLPLPELRTSGRLLDATGDRPDVEIRLRTVPIDPADPSDRWFHVRDDGTVVLHIAGVARFAVREGRRIDVEPAPGADPAEVRTYLLGSGLGLLLHQRGELPLHVSAVVIDGRAWAFTAPSGTGKSTIAAALHLHAGLPLLADDVAVARRAVTDDPGGSGAAGALALWPGLPVLKLRDDALAGVDATRFAPLPEHRGSQKVRLRLHDGDDIGPVPLAGLVLLQRSPCEDVDVRRVGGAEAFLTVQSAVYRLPHGATIATVPTVFARVAALAAEVACFHATIPTSGLPSSAVRAQAMVQALRDR